MDQSKPVTEVNLAGVDNRVERLVARNLVPAMPASMGTSCCGEIITELYALNGALNDARQARQDYIDAGYDENSPEVHRLDHIILVFEAQIDILQDIMGRCC